MRFRSKADRTIDRAHSAIADAEMLIHHSFTDADKAQVNAQLAEAVRFLNRAIAARDAWNAVDHDDYEEFPDVPEHSQHTMDIWTPESARRRVGGTFGT